jgi:hypothetical protein
VRDGEQERGRDQGAGGGQAQGAELTERDFAEGKVASPDENDRQQQHIGALFGDPPC